MRAELFYRRALEMLNRNKVPYLVGGAFALTHYTGIVRQTKDFDIFIRTEDVERTMSTLTEAGYKTEVTHPHWLGKAYEDAEFIDIIWSSGNGVAIVDEAWFENAVEGEVLGERHRICPPEEMLWSKAFVIERERYDGADIAHTIRALGERLDWVRLLRRFDRHWRVLLSHLVLFGFIYPGERGRVPAWVMKELIARMQRELTVTPPPDKVCQGTLLSRQQYLVDVNNWGYEDARLADDVQMTADDIAHWTAAIEGSKPEHASAQNHADPGRGR